MSTRSRLKTCFESLEYSSEEVVESSDTPLDICGTGGDGCLCGGVEDDALDICKDWVIEGEDCSIECKSAVVCTGECCRACSKLSRESSPAFGKAGLLEPSSLSSLLEFSQPPGTFAVEEA